jgi:hypothetical protein
MGISWIDVRGQDGRATRVPLQKPVITTSLQCRLYA